MRSLETTSGNGSVIKGLRFLLKRPPDGPVSPKGEQMPFLKTLTFSAACPVQGLALKRNDYSSNCIGVCMHEIFLYP
jgi:hypothetical protein